MRTFLVVLLALGSLVVREAVDRPVAAQQTPAIESQVASSSAPAAAVKIPPEVIITGQRELERKINDFVDHLTDFTNTDAARGLARWTNPACPLVTGLPKHHGEYILERFTQIAQEAGIPLGKEWCRPNLFIIVSKHPVEDLRDLERRHREDVFGGASAMEVEQFISMPRPVRTWYDTVEMTPEGLPMVRMSFPGVSQQKVEAVMGGVIVLPVRPAISDEQVTNPWSQASHLTLNVVWSIKRVFVVVDPTRFKGVTLGQLADYVAMSGLAQLKLGSNLADDPTILTLFDHDPQSASAGLTAWDHAFLKSFYETEQKSVMQRSQIAQGMIRHVVAQN